MIGDEKAQPIELYLSATQLTFSYYISNLCVGLYLGRKMENYLYLYTLELWQQYIIFICIERLTYMGLNKLVRVDVLSTLHSNSNPPLHSLD